MSKAENVVPYLMYGLKIQFHLHENDNGVWTLDQYNLSCLSDNDKPILIPLSDFAGKRTCGEVKDKLDCSIKVVHEIWALSLMEKDLDEISYETYIVMCKNHIDFNRLIEQGLAVDKKTIKEKQS